ncbi:hypothetical protein GCM10008955_32610 [Deinococcus malanensis]|uniref:Uncharacterized protein n=1 Tax=Deinococcus malanensis TaxID=1706855 RepID=A0ABQ2F005_9DEIO|nr:hypothetical protein [Deinococcus malanensis]GGK36149.1 hypothetical protein GCM10008955_32610 [Deinococcus malanensis]
MTLPFPDQTITLVYQHHGLKTAVEVVVYGATPRVRGYVLEDGEARRVWMFDVSPSLVGQAQRLVTGALTGEDRSMTLTGWQISLEAAGDVGARRELRVMFPEGETTCVWPVTDHGVRTELTDRQRLLTAGPL